MTRRFAFSALLACCCALPTAALAGLVPPGPPVPVTDAYTLGYQEGFAAGIPVGREECRANPSGCGIYPTNVLPPAQYGETEPNDSIYNANFIPEGVNFWGQSYSTADQDWFYVVTSEPNTNLNLTFSLPEASTSSCRTVIGDDGSISFDCSCQQGSDPATGNDILLCSLTGWIVSIRNAAGLVIAEFDTGFTSVDHAKAGINYRVTLGLAGTHYIQIRPNDGRFSYQMYNLTVMLQKSPNDNPTQNVGYVDAEIEPNYFPSWATEVFNTVSMYGTINLATTGWVCSADECQFAFTHLEDDWFKFYSKDKNQILQIAFCDRTVCSEGAWFVEIFDQPQALDYDPDGTRAARPLMTFNVQATGDPASGVDGRPGVWQIGLRNPGNYFIRVSMKRTLQALCAEWGQDRNNDGLVERDARGTPVHSCACGDGKPQCEINIPNTPTTTGEDDEEGWARCPDGSEGDAQCTVGCICTATRGVVEVPANDITAQYNFTLSTSPMGPRP